MVSLSALIPFLQLLVLLPQLADQGLESLHFPLKNRILFLVNAADFLDFFLEPILFCDFGEDLCSHGLEVGLEEFGLGMLGVGGVVVGEWGVVGSVVFLGVVAVLAKGLVLKGVECGATTGVGGLARELDDSELLLLAEVQLVEQLVVQLHHLLLQDADLLLVLATLPPRPRRPRFRVEHITVKGLYQRKVIIKETQPIHLSTSLYPHQFVQLMQLINKIFIKNHIILMSYQQYPNSNPYQTVSSNPNEPNAYNHAYNPYSPHNNGPSGGYPLPNNFGNPASGPQMNLFNPRNFGGPVPNQGSYPQNNQSKLAEEEYYSGGLQESARKGFVGKVYLLLSLQLLITAAIGFFAYNSTTFRSIFINTVTVIIVSVALLAVSIVIACCTETFRKYALSFFLLFTALEALLVAIAICGFSSKVILMAVGITLLLTFALSIYAWKTESDLTGCGVYLMLAGFALLIFGIVAIFWRDPIVQLIYSCIAALLFCVYLVYDTQLVLGKSERSFSLDDAYLAAIQLYLDIIQIFLNLLQIISYFDN